jgi:hypothetical protein
MEVGGKLYVLTALCQRRTHLPDLGRQLAGLGFGVSLLGNGMTQIVKQARKNMSFSRDEHRRCCGTVPLTTGYHSEMPSFRDVMFYRILQLHAGSKKACV